MARRADMAVLFILALMILAMWIMDRSGILDAIDGIG
jgi:hypothetical protein